MGIVTPSNKEVLDFEGLHLYHAGISNCAMRVRITLEEKNLPWTSHHLDIINKEHLTPEYFGINPKGLVPCLVDDGVVINESDDIIDYIDKKWPNPPLRPTSEQGLKEMYEWMEVSASGHLRSVKTYMYFVKLKGKMRQSEEEVRKYQSLQTDPELLDFHRKNTSVDGITQEDADKAVEIITGVFDKAETILKDNDWLVENRFSLADIAWLPSYYILVRADFPCDNHPALQAWAARFAERESYKKGVLEWWPGYAEVDAAAD